MRQYINCFWSRRKYNILIEFGVPVKLVRLMEMYVNQSIIGGGWAKEWFETRRCLNTCALEYAFRRVQETST